MPRHKSQDYKLSAVEYYLDSDVTQLEVCDIFRCSPRSLLRWTDRYLDTGSIVRHNRPATSYKIRQRHVNFILDHIKKNRTVTLNELRILLYEEFPDLSISLAHLHRIVGDNNISLKLRRVRHEPVKRYSKPVDIKEELKKFYGEIDKFELDDIICLDETNIQIFHKRNFCYSPIGKRCVVTTSSQEVFKRYTAVFAISTQGVVGWQIYPKGGIDSHRLKSFLEQHVTGKFNNKLIIMDNASCHRNPEIKKLVLEDNKLLYSVPYQHFTNAIENYFSILKSHLKRRDCENIEDLVEQIEEIIEVIPVKQYENIFRGAYQRGDYIAKRNKRHKLLKKYLE